MGSLGFVEPEASQGTGIQGAGFRVQDLGFRIRI